MKQTLRFGVMLLFLTILYTSSTITSEATFILPVWQLNEIRRRVDDAQESIPMVSLPTSDNDQVNVADSTFTKAEQRYWKIIRFIKQQLEKYRARLAQKATEKSL